MNRGKSIELFLPTLKSNIKSDPVFHNVKFIIYKIEYKLYCKYHCFL